MSPPSYSQRRRRLLAQVKAAQADAILVTNETNVTWTTGFSGDSSYLLLGPSLCVLLSDSRYTTQIESECPGLDVEIRDAGKTIDQLLVDVVGASKIRKLAFEGDSTSHTQWQAMTENLNDVETVPTQGVVEQLRQIKDAFEISEIRSAVNQAQRAFTAMRATLTSDQTERQLAHDLEHAMRGIGAQSAGFEPIVAVGANAALPHAHPGYSRVGDAGILLVDWGAKSEAGYRSDLTRTLVTGKPSRKLEKIYNTVLKAQQAAIRRIRPGASCKKIDSIARDIIRDAGYGNYFGHGLGHGIGLDIHEWPRFSPISDSKLKPGMVLTVEPGIYLPGWGGVRIEDDVLVTKTGYEVLTSVDRDFESAVVDV